MASGSTIDDMVWDRLLTSKYNRWYYEALWRRFSRRDTAVRTFLAVTSSSTVASWALWGSFPTLWQGLSAVSAVVAIIAPILGYSKTIGQLADGYRQWVHAEETFGEIRERLELGQSVSFDEYEKAKERVLPTQQSEIGLPRDERLMEACRQGVLKEVGVSDAR